MKIIRTYRFEAAHSLPKVPDGHPCKRTHGHNWLVRLTLDGSVDQSTGMVIDFFDVDKAWEQVHRLLDHQLLNDVDGLSNPTSENVALWVWKTIAPLLDGKLFGVEICENDLSSVMLER